MTSLHRLIAVLTVWAVTALAVVILGGQALLMPWQAVFVLDIVVFVVAAIATWVLLRNPTTKGQ